jgi:hypothetical protein
MPDIFIMRLVGILEALKAIFKGFSGDFCRCKVTYLRKLDRTDFYIWLIKCKIIFPAQAKNKEIFKIA